MISQNLVPGGVVTTQNMSTVIRPKGNNNSLQFVKIQTPELSKTADEQMRLAKATNTSKDKIKEVEEEWQNNLLNWKSKRRQQIGRTLEHETNDNDPFGELNSDKTGAGQRKIKTFAEMVDQRAKSGNRLGFHLQRYFDEEESDSDELKTKHDELSISSETNPSKHSTLHDDIDDTDHHHNHHEANSSNTSSPCEKDNSKTSSHSEPTTPETSIDEKEQQLQQQQPISPTQPPALPPRSIIIPPALQPPKDIKQKIIPPVIARKPWPPVKEIVPSRNSVDLDYLPHSSNSTECIKNDLKCPSPPPQPQPKPKSPEPILNIERPVAEETPKSISSQKKPPKDDKDRTILSVSGKKRCSSCREELGRGAAAFVVESLSLVYHTNCFRCSLCHSNLSNGFRAVDVRVHNGALHCQNCYSKDGLNYSRV